MLPYHLPDLVEALGPERAEELDRLSRQALEPERHGDLPRWRSAVDGLPETQAGWRIEGGRLVAGAVADDPAALTRSLKEMIPWRKGPLRLGGVDIDTEWRSDWKWDRISTALDWSDCSVLDVGAGNGYFGWRMLEAGARRVIGCDPTLIFAMQHCACLHFAGFAPNHLLPLRLEDLPRSLDGFDRVCSLGVLYHRRDHQAHLADLFRRLRPGGTLVLETLIVEEAPDGVLVPEGRYARMRNVHALPTIPTLAGWLDRAGYTRIECIDQTGTTTAEQNTTAWMPFHSLPEALDPDDPGRTIENHPAPLRAVVLATRPA